MRRPRPRRALQPRLAARVARAGVPALLVGVLGTAVAVTAWPQPAEVVAAPAPVASTASVDVVRQAQADGVTRDQRRPTLQAVAKRTATPTSKPAAKPERRRTAPKKTPTKASTKAPKKTSKKAPEKADKKAPAKLKLEVIGTRYTTTALNVRTAARASAYVTTTLDTGSTVAVTRTVRHGFRLIKRHGKPRWVRNEYLSRRKPKPHTSDGLSGAACSSGSAMESGLTRDAIRVHRAVCARFPQVSSFGGARAGDGGYHGSGRAVDCMIGNSAVGWQIARWVRANAARLGVSEVIYAQRIWTVQRSGEGWRGMPDRGSATANHDDHVHVSVYGSSGTG